MIQISQNMFHDLSGTSVEIARGDQISRHYYAVFCWSIPGINFLTHHFSMLIFYKNPKTGPIVDFINDFKDGIKKGQKTNVSQKTDNDYSTLDTVLVLLDTFLYGTIVEKLLNNPLTLSLMLIAFCLSTSYYRLYLTLFLYLLYYVSCFFVCMIANIIVYFAFKELNDRERFEKMSGRTWPIVLVSLLFLLFFILYLYGNTNVQWICNFGSGFDNKIQIIGYRSMSSNDFTEYYSYDSHDIKRLADVIDKGVVLKVSQKDGVCTLEVFKDGKILQKDDSFNGITNLNVGLGVLYSSATFGEIKPSDIRFLKDKSEYGFVSLHEIIGSIKSLFFINSNNASIDVNNGSIDVNNGDRNLLQDNLII